MIDLDKEIRLYEAKLLFYNSQARKHPHYSLVAKELGFVVKLLKELNNEREEQDK